jgi:ApbE superfamily uncharacterized protein (UPF0280 family)
MKNVQKLSLLPSNSLSIPGVTKTLAVLAAVTLLALTPMAAKAGETVSQLTGKPVWNMGAAEAIYIATGGEVMVVLRARDLRTRNLTEQ